MIEFDERILFFFSPLLGLYPRAGLPVTLTLDLDRNDSSSQGGPH
jgi:hypothetical protein